MTLKRFGAIVVLCFGIAVSIGMITFGDRLQSPAIIVVSIVSLSFFAWMLFEFLKNDWIFGSQEKIKQHAQAMIRRHMSEIERQKYDKLIGYQKPVDDRRAAGVILRDD